MKSLILQGHKIEYPDDWADDYMVIVMPDKDCPILKIEFFDENKNLSNFIQIDTSQEQ